MSKKLENQLKEVNQKIDNLAARRTELLQEQTASKAAIDEKERGLGAEILANGAEAQTTTLDFISRERAKVAGLEDAMHQADAQLSELRIQKGTIEQEIAREAYRGIVKETETTMHEFFDLIDQAVDKLEQAETLGPPLSGMGEYEIDAAELIINLREHAKEKDLRRWMFEMHRIARLFFGDRPEYVPPPPVPEERPQSVKMYSVEPKDGKKVEQANKRKARKITSAEIHHLPPSAEKADE